jgi:hypothetical protein
MALRLPTLGTKKIPGTHFSRPQGHSEAGRIMSIGKSNDLIGNRTRDLPVCYLLNVLCSDLHLTMVETDRNMSWNKVRVTSDNRARRCKVFEHACREHGYSLNDVILQGRKVHHNEGEKF